MLSVSTINVRGISNNFKRRKIFHYCHLKEFQIVYLQETHSVKNKEKMWRAQAGYKMYFSHGKSNARGVCIMINKKLPIKVVHIHKDDDGRILILDVEYESMSLSLVNIYAPNEDAPSFFAKVIQMMNNVGNFNLIIGGDFNFVLDLKKDKSGGRPNTHTKSVRIFSEFLHSNSIIDVWRVQHPNVRNFTWHRKNPYIAERLDYIFVSDSMTDMVVRSDIWPSFCTDHSTVSISIQLNNSPRGRGFWKMNVEMLKDNEYNAAIVETIQEVKKTQFQTIQAKWDFLKFRIREESVKIGKNKKNSQNNQWSVLERKLTRLKSELSNYNTQTLFSRENIEREISKITKDLDNILETKTRGAIIRSRCDWFLYGEKPSSYFFKLEKYNYTKKNRHRLERQDGSITSNPKEILDIQYEFYKKLYAKRDIKIDEDYLSNLELLTISDETKEQLEQNITMTELQKAIKDMDIDKVPGPDGLPIEFYRKFEYLIGPILLDVITAMSKNGLSLDQGRGIISLMEKPGKNLLKIPHWRPLSLLNLDAKLYSKILANRLYTTLPKIIKHEQAGFMKGRNIGENLMDLTTVIEQCNEQDIPGLIVGIDFEKAFDTVSWNSFFRILAKFNYGEKFTLMIKNLFKNITSCTINNGHASSWIPLQQGLRQGCCFSPPAFLLVVEILSAKIIENENIVGIQVGHINKKHAQFADDLWASLRATQGSLDNFLETVEAFCKYTGLKVNYDKTQILRIGSLKGSQAQLYTQHAIAWSRRIKILGINFAADKNEMIIMNYDAVIEKITKITNNWHNRSLTLLGKILIVNTLIISQLVYLFANTYSPYEIYLDRINKLIKEFLWSKGKPLIKSELLKQSIINGGLKLVDIKLKNYSLKCKWFKLAMEKSAPWVVRANTILPIPVHDVIDTNITPKDVKSLKGNSIWLDVWEAWASLRHNKVEDISDVLDQSLWCNSYIRTKNKPILTSPLYKIGIITLKDIVCTNTNRLCTWQELKEKWEIDKDKLYLEYFKVVTALPTEWKEILRKTNRNVIENYTARIYYDMGAVKFTNKIYWELVNKNPTIDTGKRYWEYIFNCQLDENWCNIRQIPFKLTLLTKLRYFQYRLLSGKLTTNYLRAKWDKDVSPLCTFCNNLDETPIHILFECEQVKIIWNNLNKWLSYMLKIKIKNFTKEQIIFNNYLGKHKEVINITILIVKQAIYATKCVKDKLNFINILSKVQNYKKIEYLTSLKTGQIGKYDKKWKMLE